MIQHPLKQIKNLKECIIAILSQKWPLSAKKLYYTVKRQYRLSVTYQAVYKAVKELSDSGVTLNQKKLYRLNPTWIKTNVDFFNSLEASYDMEGGKYMYKSSDRIGGLHYIKYKFRSTRLSFIPFYLGPVREKVLSQFKCGPNTGKKLIFEYNNNMYHLFDSGICVAVQEGKLKTTDIVTFLLDRRFHHISILSGNSQMFDDIAHIFNATNQRAVTNKDLQYVMSIFHIEKNEFISSNIIHNLLKMCVEPSIVGITDNKEKKLPNLPSIKKSIDRIAGNIDRKDIREIYFDGGKICYATWSNVVLYCDSSDRKNVLNLLAEHEVELQHLWFLFHITKNKITNKLIKGEDIKNYFIECTDLWQKFTTTNPLLDSQYYNFKEALIETSKIRQLFKELVETFNLLGGLEDRENIWQTR